MYIQSLLRLLEKGNFTICDSEIKIWRFFKFEVDQKHIFFLKMDETIFRQKYSFLREKNSWNIRGWFFWLFVNFFLFSVLLLLFNPSPTLILFSSKLRKVLEQKVVFKFSFRLFVRLFVCLLAQTYSEIILHDAVVLALPVCISSRRLRFVSIIQLRLKLKLCCRRGTWTNN